MALVDMLRQRARALKTETLALYLAARDPRVPWYARVLVAGIVAYALSPIDLIPDFIPILGYLDDVILVPLGITLALRMIPPEVMAECRTEAHERLANGHPTSRAAKIVIILIWILAAGLAILLVYRAIDG
ncbi:MAG: DUF1232 domain-containing protein [Chloroflexi bacterium]|nr:DUF1232 domain-containing protein [Chloroflexota bacterium]